MASNPAPGELELVRAFVNTWEADEGTESVSGPADLRAWLAEHELLDPGARVTAAEHRQAIEVREALRALLLQNAGLDVGPDAGAALDAAARRARLGVRFAPDGGVRTEAEAGGVAGALGRLLAIVSASMADGSWERLKACRAEDCRWAFYDRARNRSRHWCSMAVCGNRTKARTFRRRHAA